MRFDDSLDTVLAADTAMPAAAAAMWRQLVDLVARGRAADVSEALARLSVLRPHVPVAARASSARAAAFAEPPAALVGLLVVDDLPVAAPLLRVATLSNVEWLQLLPDLAPAARGVLRHRRDLPGDVVRALEAFGPTDFVLPDDAVAPPPSPAISQPVRQPPTPIAVPAPAATTFVSVSSVARALPVVEEALRRADDGGAHDRADGTFAIADLVARIEAFRRRRADPVAGEIPLPEEWAPATGFRFETDAAGVVSWVEGAARGPLIGLALDLTISPDGARADRSVAGAFQRRASFEDARLTVAGRSDAAGDWRISGIPLFDKATGRFVGYSGSARRPRPDEKAEPAARGDMLRQLVHELRTPTNAISGFAEMIEGQLLGPVPDVYRGYARSIRQEAAELVAAIDDIDLTAQMEADALQLRPGRVAVANVLARVSDELTPLVTLRQTNLVVDVAANLVAAGDERAIERLLTRLAAALVGLAAPGEAVTIRGAVADGRVVLGFSRPAALDTAEHDDDMALPGAPLGTTFALRLASNLAHELNGTLKIGARRLTLRLPEALDETMEQVTVG